MFRKKRLLRASPQVTPVAQELPGSPLSARIPPPQRSGSITCSRNGLLQRPLSNVSSDLSIKQRNITHFSLKLGLCMLLAIALLNPQMNTSFSYSAVAYNGSESNASNNFYSSPISVKRNSGPTLLQTNPNDYYQTISQTKIFQHLVPLNMICPYLLFFMLSINFLENFVPKENRTPHQKGSRNSISQHFIRYDILNFTHYLLIKLFYNVNSSNIYKLYSKFYISNITMTGVTPVTPSPFNPLFPTFNFSINYYREGNSISLITLQTNSWLLISPHTPQTDSWVLTLFIMAFSVFIFAILMYFNFKIYFKRSNKTKSRFSKKQNNKGLLMQLILLTVFKSIILAIICFSAKQKISTTHKPHKLVNKNYFLSIEYFADSYHSMELQTKSLHRWYAMSKIKFKNYKSFFQMLILLSGDIAMNPGPSSYPCSKCNTGV